MRNIQEPLDTLVRLWPKTIKEAFSKYATHLARYIYAQKFAAGKSVCDIACGVGYGSSYLAQTAKLVVAMDIAAEAINWARQYFSSDNIRFLTADALKPWPIGDKFDVITSFETIEHLAYPEKFLDNVNNHLSAGGTLMLSVPNGPLDLKRHSDNYNHVQHFCDTELKNLLNRRFSRVDYLSQVYTKNLRHYLLKLIKMQSIRLVSNYDFVPDLLPHVKTWLAVARK
jgi:2-polyprenyl-3-methyl-5-hydroxy-6-metoxy-1,4-benzoquinol methylase